MNNNIKVKTGTIFSIFSVAACLVLSTIESANGSSGHVSGTGVVALARESTTNVAVTAYFAPKIVLDNKSGQIDLNVSNNYKDSCIVQFVNGGANLEIDLKGAAPGSENSFGMVNDANAAMRIVPYAVYLMIGGKTVHGLTKNTRGIKIGKIAPKTPMTVECRLADPENLLAAEGQYTDVLTVTVREQS
ncbi:MAG: hypothetical protein LBJ19_01490 [Holosporaceae bacterium]|jgi:hypothetical protein|nr:hypothetical protein [Holosporaceae bacterium]